MNISQKSRRSFFSSHGLHRRILSILLMAAALAAVFAFPAFAQSTYIITDGATVIVHTTRATDARKIISEAGVDLRESDTYTTQETDGVSEIIINRVKMVSVDDGGQLSVIGSYGGTVADVLNTLRITLADSDRLSCGLEDPVTDGMEITITRVQRETLEYDKRIPYETLRYESSALAEDDQQILSAGSDGLMHVTAEITYENGREVSRTIQNTQILTPASNEVVLFGVDRSVKEQVGRGLAPAAQSTVYTASAPSAPSAPAAAPVTVDEQNSSITTISGATLTYSKILSCKATAYTCEGYTGHTYSGTVARVGAIAVDPSFIPLGTELYIVADDGYCIYGYCVAEDTGGLIKGNRVDLYFDTYEECINFGYRPVTVYVLN